jgi:tetratricopeptide (TPR) repeat protein
MYLPFLGLVLVCLELLRRLKVSQTAWVGAAVLAICSVLTFQRSSVWANPVALWQDAANKSPRKWRPHFQVAYALYEFSRCAEAAQAFDTTSRLQPPSYDLLLDWGLALDCAGDWQEALVKMQQSSTLQPSAHVQSQIGMVYAKHNKFEEAMAALAQGERIDPHFDMTYMYRGQIFEATGYKADAAAQYQRALTLNPLNSVARDGLARVSQ